MRRHPDFMIIGGPRSGTTFLYDLLKQHPEIYLRENKRPEPHFFALTAKYEKGIDAYYEEVFPDYSGQPVSGEASTTMLYCLDAIPRIKQHFPEMKFICYLREPVGKLVSEYNRSVESGWEKLSLQEALEAEPARLEQLEGEYHQVFKPGGYRFRGHYADFVEKWLDAFPRAQFYFGLTTELIADPVSEMKQVCRFLGVDEHFEFAMEKTDKNSSGKFTHDQALLGELRTYYKYSIQRLSKLIDRDLSGWQQR